MSPASRPGEQCGDEGVQQRLACQFRIERPDPFGCPHQQGGGVSAAVHRKGDPRPHQVGSSSLELVEGGGFCGTQQRQGRLGITGFLLGVGGSQGPFTASRRIRSQFNGFRQERRRRREASATLRQGCRTFELVGDLVVGAGGSMGAMPCAAGWVGTGLDRLCQRTVHVLTRLG